MVAVFSVTELVHKDSRLLKSADIEINDVVLTKYGVGIVKYIGNVGLKSNYFNFLGVELEFPNGKNNGYVKGKKFFQCKTGHGIFTKPTNVRKVPSGCLYFCLKDVVLQLNEFHSERKAKDDSRAEELILKHRKVVMSLERDIRSKDDTILKLEKNNRHLTDELQELTEKVRSLEEQLSKKEEMKNVTPPSRHPLESTPKQISSLRASHSVQYDEVLPDMLAETGLPSLRMMKQESPMSDRHSHTPTQSTGGKRYPGFVPDDPEPAASLCIVTPEPSFPTELGNQSDDFYQSSNSDDDREHTPEPNQIFPLPPKNAGSTRAKGGRAPSFSFADSDSDFSDSFSVEGRDDESPTPSAASLVSLKQKDLAFDPTEAKRGINLRSSVFVKYNNFEKALKLLDSHQGRNPDDIDSAGANTSDAPEPPSDIPPQPKKFPKRLLQDEKILVCYEGDSTWWKMIVEKHRIGKKKAQCKGLDLWDGDPWADNIPLSEFFLKKQLYFCNGQLYEEDQKEKQCMGIFNVLDVMGDKELTFEEFQEGLEIFELNFRQTELKSVFLEILGGEAEEDADADEGLSDEVIDFELFLEFMMKPSAHPTAIRFKRDISRVKLPERILVTCKDTGKKVAQSKSQQCHLCRSWVWHRVAHTHENKYFCSACFNKKHCEQCKTFTLTVVTNEVEEKMCQECYFKNYHHEVELVLDKAPLPFDIWPSDSRPFVRNIDSYMLVNDINDGDPIININQRNVSYMTASQFLDLFKDNSIQLPITITILSRVKEHQALRELKTYFTLANLSGYISDDEE